MDLFFYLLVEVVFMMLIVMREENNNDNDKCDFIIVVGVRGVGKGWLKIGGGEEEIV